MVNRLEFKDNREKGATLVEASIILPIFILFIFGIILVSAQLFSVYSTYYACIQSLKSVSTGPLRDDTGRVIASVEQRLYDTLNKKLSVSRTGTSVANVLFRNDSGCYIYQDQQSTAYVNESLGCPQNSGQLKINPNSWLTVEIRVKPLGLKSLVFLPDVKVRSTIKMYDWI